MSSSLLVLLSASFTWQRLIPLILRDYGASDMAVGAAFFVISLGHALPQVLGGIVADRWGRKVAIVVPGVLAVGIYLLMSMTRSWVVLALLVFCNRCMGAIQAPSFAAILAESVSKEKRGMAFAVFQVAAGLGYTVGPIVGAFLLRSYQVHQMMVLNSLALAIATAMRWFLLSETAWGPAGGPPVGREPLTLTELRRAAARVWVAVWRPGGRLILAAGTLFTLVLTMTTQGPYIPMHAQDVLGFDKSQVNLLFSAGPVVAMTVSLVVGSFIGKMGAALILLVGVAGFGPVLALWLGAGDFASAMVIFTAAYVFLQVATIAYDTLRAELVEGQGRGLALGILGAMTGTVAALGPPFASWLRERTHPMVPFWLTFAALGLMVVLLASHELPRLAGRRRVRPASSAGAS